MPTLETMITVLGSFLVAISVFYVRQWVQKQRLQRAISTELQATDFLDKAIEAEATPVNEFLSIAILEANIDWLGYFKRGEIQHLVNYINSANRMKNAIKLYRTPKDEFSDEDKPDNLPNIIQGEAKVARDSRNELLRSWGKNPDEIIEIPDSQA